MAIKTWTFTDAGDVLSTDAISNNDVVWTDVGMVHMATATSDKTPVWTSVGELPPADIE